MLLMSLSFRALTSFGSVSSNTMAFSVPLPHLSETSLDATLDSGRSDKDGSEVEVASDRRVAVDNHFLPYVDGETCLHAGCGTIQATTLRLAQGESRATWRRGSLREAFRNMHAL